MKTLRTFIFLFLVLQSLVIMPQVATPLFADTIKGNLDATSSPSVGTTYQTISVNGITRAIEYLTPAGAVSSIELLLDSAVTDYGDASTIGSYAWAIAHFTSAGRIHLGSGVFPCATPVIIGEPIMTDGESQQATNLQALSAISVNTFIEVTSSNVGFRNITIDANQMGGSAVDVSTGLSGFTMDHTTIKNGNSYGLSMISDSDTKITNSDFTGSGTCQFYMTTDKIHNVDGLQITNSLFDDTEGANTTGGGTHYVCLYGLLNINSVTTQNIIIKGNVIRYHGDGSSLESDGLVLTNNGQGSQILNAIVSENAITLISGATNGSGIEIRGVSNGVISGNVINNAQTGIDLSYTSNGVCSGNTINGYLGIGILENFYAGPGVNWNVTDNTMTGAGTGVTVGIDALGTGRISGNTIVMNSTNTGSFGILTGGYPLDVHGNTIYDNAASTGIQVQTVSGARVTNNHLYLGTNAIGITVNAGTANCFDNVVSDNWIGAIYGQTPTYGINFTHSSSYLQEHFTGENNHISNCLVAFELDPNITTSVFQGNTCDLPNMTTFAYRFNALPTTGVIVIDDLTPITFTNLPSPVPAAGSRFLCIDCTAGSTPCSGSGTGHIAWSNGTALECD